MSDYAYFIDKIRKKTGINLSLYKEQQMKRRLEALSGRHGFQDLKSFYTGIDRDDQLLEQFLSHMTINVSEFFRNESQWKVLEKLIVSGPLQDRAKLKVWSAACSSGEEPYSLGILLSEHRDPGTFSITATDLDKSILQQAKQGIYPASALKKLEKATIQEHFQEKSPGVYQINDPIKRLINFRQSDLLKDRFQRNFDLIVCRNVMIYFNEEAKHTLLNKLSQSLAKGGVLFIGSTEQIFNPSQYGLETISSFFYQKK
ncbi:CheR family methyltransferase [Virgibacillus sediminis]|uniref:protein-glutamate O-methyltransferase n=1 Tax=Virgibacillus sediminis TaxID=202260 RepID=A0ABV7A4F1_9BACI